MLTEKEKTEMLEDARSIARRQDFRKLSDVKEKYFTLVFMEMITETIPIKYPRHIIKADKNQL